ncbi:hypothetical protein AAVH_26779 [Aphelenchoides avenae]|nr:hypothetical protein AAVH_26779 [Aphelenchus avenae]
MPASLQQLRRVCDDDLITSLINQCDIMEGILRKIGVEPSNMPMRPNYDHLTQLARLEASTEHCKGLVNVANKQSTGCAELIDRLTTAIERLMKAPLRTITNETINGLGEAESKKVLGLAIKAMFYQAKQVDILIGENSAGENFIKLFDKQREMYEKHAQEVERELQRRKNLTFSRLVF